MMPRIVEFKNLRQAKAEMSGLGADRPGIELMAPKALFRVIKLKNVRPVAANIIKQEMLALGGEAATTRGAINQSVKQTDILVLGTLKQVRRLIKKLKAGYFGLPAIALEMEISLQNYEQPRRKMKIGPRVLEFGRRTYVMGILNVTPDSFSDGNQYFGLEEAVGQARRMMEEGADIIDIGGESTRPGAKPITTGEEIGRVVPVIKRLRKVKGMIISIDTRKALVAAAALRAGAHMVNDVSGLRYDKKMAGVISRFKVPVCIMHTQGEPANMQKKPAYSDLLGEIAEYLAEGLAIASKAGILLGKILVDPGIGFGKTVEHNLVILKKLKELKVLGCPILVGPSRKSFIGKILDLPVDQRLEGTVAAAVVAIMNGADIVRVHDVRAVKRAARMADAIVRL